jgi:hypothetical protein
MLVRGFVFSSLFAFSSERCVFVAIRNLDVIGSERLASLRLSFDLRLEMAVRGLFSLPLKVALPPERGPGGAAALDRAVLDRARASPWAALPSLEDKRREQGERGKRPDPPSQPAGVASRPGILLDTRPLAVVALRPRGNPAGPPAIGEAGRSLRARTMLPMSLVGLRGTSFIAVIFVLPFDTGFLPPELGSPSEPAGRPASDRRGTAGGCMPRVAQPREVWPCPSETRH